MHERHEPCGASEHGEREVREEREVRFESRIMRTPGTDPMEMPSARPSAALRPLELTPSRVRLGALLVLALVAGVTCNALLQRSGAGLPSTAGSVHDDLVTGIRAPSAIVTAPAAGDAAITTAGVPQTVAPTATGEEMRHWRERLARLEAEARDSRTLGTSTAPSIARRTDGEPVTPVTQQTVRAIQRELTERGYDPGSADGNIGVLTQAAIMAFEHDQGRPLTGEPSERLLRQIVLGTSLEDGGGEPASGRDADSAQRILQGVQKALVALKYAPGKVDGSLHEETVRAIREFEMDQGLVPTGRVSGRLIVRLARASGKAFVVPAK